MALIRIQSNPAWLLITFASNLSMVYAGRSIQGFCVGLTTLALPIYLGETIQPHVRGTLGLLPTTIGNIGKSKMFITIFYLKLLNRIILTIIHLLDLLIIYQ